VHAEPAQPLPSAAIWFLPASWTWQEHLRDLLAPGNSHGLLVALAAYSAAAGEDLAAGRHIAATGTVRLDGMVGQLVYLPQKARAAMRAGADVLVFPAGQEAELEGLRDTELTLIAATSVGDAIAQLRAADPGQV